MTTVQGVAGCGSLRLGAEFLAMNYQVMCTFLLVNFVFFDLVGSSLTLTPPYFSRPMQQTVYIPDQTYPNHPNFFTSVGLVVKTFRYYDPATRGMDFQGPEDFLYLRFG